MILEAIFKAPTGDPRFDIFYVQGVLKECGVDPRLIRAIKLVRKNTMIKVDFKHSKALNVVAAFGKEEGFSIAKSQRQ